MDWDKNGTISCIEFKSYLAKLKKGEDLDHEDVVEAFNAIDVDGSKQINWAEFYVSTFLTHCVHYCKEIKENGVIKWLLRIRSHQNFAKKCLIITTSHCTD